MVIEPLLPEIARRGPRRPLRTRYRPSLEGRLASVPTGCQHTVERALHAAGLAWLHAAPLTWAIQLPWTTLVLGMVRRRVVERLVLRLAVSRGGAAVLELEANPLATHSAHAAGFAGVLVVAAGAWAATGWITGLPAGLTTAVAGGLWADAARTLALTALERRLCRLLDDVGQALWPGAAAELL